MDLLTLLLFALGFVLLIVGAEWLVRGSSQLAGTFGISPLVIGLTVVAFGTSAPELAVSLQAAVDGRAGIALGNIVGSNICNVLLILGVAAVLTPLVVERQLVWRELPLMIGASVLCYLLALDGAIGRAEGALLFSGIIVYTLHALYDSRRRQRADLVAAARPPTSSPSPPPLWRSLAMTGLGLLLLVLGARWLVGGAVAIAAAAGVSELVIGLTVIALGTSLPELAATAVACWRGHGGIAVGAAVGSNLFNILSVLGLTALFSPDGIPVDADALSVDLPIMIVTACACLPIFFTGYRIVRWEGGLFLAYYLFYMLYLALNATAPHRVETLTTVALVILPLTFLALLGLVLRDRQGAQNL